MSTDTYDPNKLQITHEAVWRRMHHLPPMGYVSDFQNYKMIPDPELFPKLRRVWELVLEGIPIDQVRVIANEEFGIRTPKHGTLGGKPLARCALYRMLAAPFYSGVVQLGNEFFSGLHEPMVTKEEFVRVQEVLQKRRRNREVRSSNRRRTPDGSHERPLSSPLSDPTLAETRADSHQNMSLHATEANHPAACSSLRLQTETSQS